MYIATFTMDIFKLLSRSTNLQKGSKSAASNKSQAIPSAGQVANPQIFGKTSNPGKSSTKSREEPKSLVRLNQTSATENGQLPAELAYTRENRKRKRGSDGADVSKELLARNAQAEMTGPSPVEEEKEGDTDKLEARKRILNQHKIKITTLAGLESESTEKKKKTSKTSSKAKEDKTTGARTALYPRPLTAFSQLPDRYAISTRLAQNIKEQGYKLPTEVQLAALPILLGSDLGKDGESEAAIQMSQQQGMHLLSVAPTGSGKTLAFLIPIVQRLIEDRAKLGQANGDATGNEGSRAIVVAPTRELANQITNEARKLVANTGIKVSLVRKGMRVHETSAERKTETKDLDDEDNNEDNAADESDEVSEDDVEVTNTKVKSDILVSTPLTLLHALGSEEDPTPSPTVRHLVLDEADVLLDPLFRDQTMAIWRSCTNPQLQATLWSATMPSSIEALILSTLQDNGSKLPIIRLVVGLKDTSLPTITHALTYAATESGKLLAIRQLLHPTSASTDSQGRKALRPPFLVFTQTIERAIALHAELKFDIPPEAGGSSRIAVLHSGLSETTRSKIMTSFRKGEVWVIITTDLLARGVDFRGLNGVVNYDVPTSAAAYVHRVGRTGRAGREGGVAVTLYTKEDVPYIKGIANVIAASEKLKSNLGGPADGGTGIKQWLLDALPTPTKRQKQELKQRGVESRRKGIDTERISTKSSYDRRNETKRKEARDAAVRRKQGGPTATASRQMDGDSDNGFEGFD